MGSPKIKEKKIYIYILRQTRSLSAESFTGYISIPLRITIMTKLEIFQNWGRFSSGDIAISLWSETWVAGCNCCSCTCAWNVGIGASTFSALPPKPHFDFKVAAACCNCTLCFIIGESWGMANTFRGLQIQRR